MAAPKLSPFSSRKGAVHGMKHMGQAREEIGHRLFQRVLRGIVVQGLHAPPLPKVMGSTGSMALPSASVVLAPFPLVMRWEV